MVCLPVLFALPSAYAQEDTPAEGQDKVAATQPLAEAPESAETPESRDPSPAEPSEPPPESFSLEDVTVTASRVETSRLDIPADVTAFSREDVHKPGAQSFRDALKRTPGVKLNTRQNNAIFSGLEVRGLSTNSTSGGNTLILLDGIPQRRLSFGGPYMGGLPFDAVTRMELAKGPLSSLYGRGALAGALQLFTDPGSKDFKLDTNSMYETETNAVRNSVRVSGPLEFIEGATFSLTGSGTHRGGWQPDTEACRYDIYQHLHLPVGERDTLKILFGYFEGTEGAAAPVLIDRSGERLPFIGRDTNLAVPDLNSIDMTEYRLGLIWTHDFSDTLQSKFTTSYWRGDTTWRVGRPSDAPAAGGIVNRPASIRTWQESGWFNELQLQQKYELSEDIKGTLTGGISGELWDYNNRFRLVYTNPANTRAGIPIDYRTQFEPHPARWIYDNKQEKDTDECDIGLFLKNQISLGKRWDVHMGLRWDYYRRKQVDRYTRNSSTVSDDALSPTAGVVYHLIRNDNTDVGLYGNWGLGFNPVFRGVGGAEIVELEPETSQSFEGGIRGLFWGDKLESTLAFYRIRRNDVVGYNPDTLTQQNLGNWTIDGIEFGLKLRPVDGLLIYGNYTVRDPEITKNAAFPETEGNGIPFVSEQMFTVGAEYRHRCGLGGGIETRFYDTNFADDANTVRLSEYFLVDAFISYKWKRWELSIYANNLLDQEYYSAVFNGVRNGSAFEGTPRTFGVSVSASFGGSEL